MTKDSLSSALNKTPCRGLLIMYGLIATALLTISGVAFAERSLITYDQQHELLANNNPEPLLSIDTNGKARAVYPEYMKKAGVYEWQLADSELQALRKLAGKLGIQQFDEQAVQEEIEKNDRQDNILHSISDSTTTVIDIKSLNESGEVLEGANTNGGELQNIAFEDVPEMAEQNPEITELNELESLQSRLEAILDQANQSNRIR